MKISHLTQGDLVSFKSILGTNRPKGFPPYLENPNKMAIKFNGSDYDGFKKVVGK